MVWRAEQGAGAGRRKADGDRPDAPAGLDGDGTRELAGNQRRGLDNTGVDFSKGIRDVEDDLCATVGENALDGPLDGRGPGVRALEAPQAHYETGERRRRRGLDVTHAPQIMTQVPCIYLR
jgi:hypothetical protein